jgi:predicted nucleic acid-binding protein
MLARVVAVVRLAMNPAVAGVRRTFSTAMLALAALRAWPGHRFLPDDVSFATAGVDHSGLVGYRQVTDFHLVALAKANGATLATLDAGIRAALLPVDKHLVEVV